MVFLTTSCLSFIVGTSLNYDNVPWGEVIEIIPFLPVGNLISFFSFFAITQGGIEPIFFSVGHVLFWTASALYIYEKNKWALTLISISGFFLSFYAYGFLKYLE